MTVHLYELYYLHMAKIARRGQSIDVQSVQDRPVYRAVSRHFEELIRTLLLELTKAEGTVKAKG